MGLVFPPPPSFSLPPVFYFLPYLRFPQDISGVFLLFPGQEKQQRSLRTSWALQSCPWQLEGERRWFIILAVIIPVPLSSWSSGLMPGKGWHRPYLSAPDPAAVQPRSFRRSTALRGFQGRVARKLSQFIPRLWSDLSKTKPEGAVHVIF